MCWKAQSRHSSEGWRTASLQSVWALGDVITVPHTHTHTHNASLLWGPYGCSDVEHRLQQVDRSPWLRTADFSWLQHETPVFIAALSSDRREPVTRRVQSALVARGGCARLPYFCSLPTSSGFPLHPLSLHFRRRTQRPTVFGLSMLLILLSIAYAT